MKNYGTASSKDGLRLPHSGFLLGILAEALRLKAIFKEDCSGTSYKTIQRYFAGERVEPKAVETIISTFVDALVPQTMVLPPEAGDDLALHTVVFGGVLLNIRRWESVVTSVNSLVYPVDEEKDLPVPVLRLVFLELGMRWGAWKKLQETTTGTPPKWDIHPLTQDALRRIIDSKRGSVSVQQIAEEVGVSTQAVEAWRGGRSLPTNNHIESLGKILARHSGSPRQETELLLRTQIALLDLRKRFEDTCGQHRIEDMLQGALLTAKLLFKEVTEGLDDNDPLPLDLEEALEARRLRSQVRENIMPLLWFVIIHGAACPFGNGLAYALADMSKWKPEVSQDFAALSSNWVGRIRFWMQQLGTRKREEASLRCRLKNRAVPASLSPDEFVEMCYDDLLRMKDFDRVPRLRKHVRMFKLPPEGSATHHVGQANQAESLGDIPTAVEFARQAVQAQPKNAFMHFRLGAFLGQHGNQLQDISIMEEGLAEVRVAVALDEDFGNARNEIGIILANLRRHEEAEIAFAEAEPYWGDHSHHWHSRGVNYIVINRIEEAATALQKAIKLTVDGEHVEAKIRLAATLMALGRTAEAKRLGKKVQHITGFDPTTRWEELLDAWANSPIRRQPPRADPD